MIKETCACGAMLSIDQGQYMKAEEIRAAAAWRLNHRHEFPPTLLEVPDMKPAYQFSGPIDVRQAEQDGP